MRTPTELAPHEQARLYRDRLRGLEQERVQKEAAKLAGDDVPKAELDSLDKRIEDLEKAAKAAEADAAASDEGGR